VNTSYSISKPCQLLEKPENKMAFQFAIACFFHPFFKIEIGTRKEHVVILFILPAGKKFEYVVMLKFLYVV
jgi:hypothetical protein